MILSGKRVVAFSPHLDDAALSVGATISELAEDANLIHVVTLFSGIPDGFLSSVARKFHAKCGLPDSGMGMEVRRQEDLEAMKWLGVTCEHADFLDAVFRRTASGEWVCKGDRSMFDQKNVQYGPDGLEEYLTSVFDASSPDLIMTCSANGGHIDHIITRETVLAVADRKGIPALLWEDIPYAIGKKAQSPLRVRSELVRLSPRPKAWANKWKSAAQYVSQLDMLWEGADWKRSMQLHALRRGNFQELTEIFWRRLDLTSR
ncbi:PIG-L deacetylase family protein [Streptomyces sp. NPDC058319]|uniref:PIG-L deacetylase family protein n=1 Tax=unclassified Streptomyces TaxID=2593676 RepID=UPI0036ECEAAE